MASSDKSFFFFLFHNFTLIPPVTNLNCHGNFTFYGWATLEPKSSFIAFNPDMLFY